VDSEIPLVPFIDLLLCCVMFLLVTAVWNQLAAVETSTPSSAPRPEQPVDTPLDAAAHVPRAERAPTASISFADGTSARVGLTRWPTRSSASTSTEVIELHPDDDVPHATVVDVLSALHGGGHSRVRVLVHPHAS
jgi:biopolymer transport protein ExbD